MLTINYSQYETRELVCFLINEQYFDIKNFNYKVVCCDGKKHWLRIDTNLKIWTFLNLKYHKHLVMISLKLNKGMVSEYQNLYVVNEY